jgi:hypothetical protein
VLLVVFAVFVCCVFIKDGWKGEENVVKDVSLGGGIVIKDVSLGGGIVIKDVSLGGGIIDVLFGCIGYVGLNTSSCNPGIISGICIGGGAIEP